MANIIEKIIMTKTDSDFNTGDIIKIKVDWAMVHDGTIVLTQKYFNKIALKVFNNEKIYVVFDHLYPPNNENTANLLNDARTFIKEQGIKNFYEGGEGICHQILLETEEIKKGDFLVGADSHSSTVGAKSCLSMGVGATDMAYIFSTGETWIKVPECIKIKMIGKLNKNVTYKDVFLKIVKDLGIDGASYKGIVYEAEENISIDDKAVLCNMGVEIGAKFSIFEDSLDGNLRSDSDEDFEKVYVYNLEEVGCNIACPNDINEVLAAELISDIKIDVAFIGTCTGGRLSDFIQAAEILKNKKISKGVRLLLAPSSRNILIEIIQNGVLLTLIKAGAVLLPVGCGPCLGGHLGVLGENEVAISTANRNFLGRMGSKSSEIYIGSANMVAHAALKGFIGEMNDV